MEKRFIVGIDLGTTNSSVAYIDLEDKNNPEQIHLLKIPQLTSPGTCSELSLLPSFLYIPGTYDILPEDIVVPWNIEERTKEDKNFVGQLARDHGAKVPFRLVSSAKSWLCNKMVDRKARILPWGADKSIFKISPIQASASYLKHIRKIWNLNQGDNDSLYLENQIIVITVPASFDEIARKLTLESVNMAGLQNVILLEEPLAAFYNWLSENKNNSSNQIKINQLILVCDVGGGTTDFTLVCLKKIGDKQRFERLAVGDHLILGGDNIDIEIARKVAIRLYKRLEIMSNSEWSSLQYQCRNIKEKMLNGQLTSDKVIMTSSGSNLISNTLTSNIDIEDVEDIIFEKFFPITGMVKKNYCDLYEEKEGLPYENNTSITNHLGNFIRSNQSEIEKLLNTRKMCPDFVLFNGGTLKSHVIQSRIISFLESEFPEFQKTSPVIINNNDFSSAVSFGGAYYGLVKNKKSLMVGSGSSRAFYLGIQKEKSLDFSVSPKQAVCFVERGLEEGSTVCLPQKQFKILTNQPVSIHMYSSSFRSGDSFTDIVEVDDTLTKLPPIHTIIQLGEKEISSKIPINIEATYTEVGTLEIWCKSISTPHKWKLNFQLRNSKCRDIVSETEVFENSKINLICDLVKDTFLKSENDDLLTSLTKRITKNLGRSKNQWSLDIIRSLVDIALEHVNVRKVSPISEGRWLNFVGFCLRPGIGEGFDSYRIKKLWKLYKQGPFYSNHPQVLSEWWIMWRRVAAGLNSGQQRQFFQDVNPTLMNLKNKRKSKQEKIEIWMAVANMESLNLEDKTKLGNQLLSDINRKKVKTQLLWALSRLGARTPLYSSIDRVVDQKQVSIWLTKIIKTEWHNHKAVVNMVSLMAQKTGDQVRDITPNLRSRIIEWIKSLGTFETHIEKVENIIKRNESDQKIIFGDSIPSGILFHTKKS